MEKRFKQRGVTVYLLWQQYRQQYPKGYGHTQFHAPEACDGGQFRSGLYHPVRKNDGGHERLMIYSILKKIYYDEMLQQVQKVRSQLANTLKDPKIYRFDGSELKSAKIDEDGNILDI